jgi:hypothetical protein
MLALTTTGLWLLLLHLRTRRTILLLSAVLCTSLGILAKLPGISIIAVMIWVSRRHFQTNPDPTGKSVKRLLIALAVTLLPCVLYYRWAVYLGNSHPPYHVAGHGYFFQDPVGFIKNVFYLPQLARHLKWLIGFPILLLVGIGGLAMLPSSEDKTPFDNLFRVWLAAVGAVYLFTAQELTVNPWNLATLCLPLAGLAGEGWLRVVQHGPDGRGLLFGAFVAALFWWSSGSIVKSLRAPVSYSSWQLGERLRQLSNVGELVVTAAAEIGDPVAIYYSRRRGWVFPPGGLCPPGGPVPDDDWGMLEDDAAAVQRIQALHVSGARWVGIVRGAKDHAGQLLVVRNPSLVDYLSRVAEYSEETDDWLIYKLPAHDGETPEIVAEQSCLRH